MSTLAIDLAGNFEPGTAALAGVAGAAVMLVPMYAGKAMGMTSMDLLRTLGTMALPKAARNVVYGVGAMMHLMMGAVLGVGHAGLLHLVDPSSEGGALGFGLLFGAVHGVIVANMMPIMLTKMHPLVRSGELSAPGVAMTGLGKMTPVGIIMAHVVFALVAGGIYTSVVG